MALVIMTFLILMLFISFIATTLIPLLKTFRGVFPELRMGLITVFLLQFAVPFLMVWFTITVMYIFFPKINVQIFHALSGALFAAVFSIAKHILRGMSNSHSIRDDMQALTAFVAPGCSHTASF
jgi:uncharacterized BrkB/YihY/UPF0761 family membrane protein